MLEKQPVLPELPPIPAKRYFTIGEVSELCAVKPHVLRYWEQEFSQLKPIKRRGNRRYYQHHEVLLIRRIRGLLYEEGFTISGARSRLEEMTQREDKNAADAKNNPQPILTILPSREKNGRLLKQDELRRELQNILDILKSR
ncbi:MAG: MerR family transcriptional regulator [Burkholderiales bacterium]|jgi:DNA-binding transcriptional MerR regulator|nr:MerR family transcriptional regulator [Burkholderiales bacterium]